MYKSSFKDLKRKCPPPDYSCVLDFDNIDGDRAGVVNVLKRDTKLENDDAFLMPQMKPVQEWEVYELKEKPGLLFIKNPFNWIGQRYWICRCLQDFSLKPNRINLDAHNELYPGEEWWDSCLRKDNRSVALRKKLRWATMGYHHDWNTKVYSDDARDPFPKDLAALSRFVAKAVGFTEPFEAQAAIVNYYHLDSTLSGHTDHSEKHATAPLLSFSFGQTCIFLLGGQSVDDVPTPMYIKSGDIIIMSGYSRLCYHGIPKILKSTFTPWEPDAEMPKSCQDDPESCFQELNQDCLGKSECGGSLTAENKINFPPKCKRRKLEAFSSREKVVCTKVDHLSDQEMWMPFKKYVESSRINMNVRQVLFAGQTNLKPAENIDMPNKS